VEERGSVYREEEESRRTWRGRGKHTGERGILREFEYERDLKRSEGQRNKRSRKDRRMKREETKTVNKH